MTDREERRTTYCGPLDEPHELLDTVADLAYDGIDEGLEPDEAVRALRNVADELEDRYDV